MAVKKTKKEHLAALKSIQSSIGIQIVRVNKEAHIPIWMLRTWAADIKAAVSFIRKEMRQELESRLEKSSRKLRKK